MCNQNEKLRLKSTWEFVDGNHYFFIPSYQRGYRWDEKQVKDLLEDICSFSNEYPQVSPFYCLQPSVVKHKRWIDNNKECEGWEVIDGQQRLTTLLLLFQYLVKNISDAKVYEGRLYRMSYQTRPNLNFSNINPRHDIDSYYAANANNIIEQWFNDNCDRISNSSLVDALLKNTNKPQVKFIWYEIDEDTDQESCENELATIRIFNNLNKGKIRLTSAELIKALFILHSKDAPNSDNLSVSEIAYVWNDIETRLYDDRFWYFLSNTKNKYLTRIDIIFDFMTMKGDNSDDDYSYRKFQQLFDGRADKDWTELGITNLNGAWIETKKVFQTFIYWFEDNVLYHYIGFLIAIGVSLRDIYNECYNVNKDEIAAKLRTLIRNKINPKNDLDIASLDYSNGLTRKLLLLFNVETYIKQNNLSTVSHNRFPFDLYKTENWDIEHVASQTENPLKDAKDKVIWLNFVSNLSCNKALKDEAFLLKEKIEKAKKDEKGEFESIYNQILNEVQTDRLIDPDNIGNLALLDAGTNRGYGNALYPTKRQEIIKKDKAGGFVPICTKNMFLKYYSDKEQETSQWKNSWTNEDSVSYRKAIEENLSWINKL